MMHDHSILRFARRGFDLHSLAHVAFANYEVACTRIGPVDRILTGISALPSKFGIGIGPVLGCEPLLSFHEFSDLTFDELSVTLDWTERRRRNHTSNESGHGQDKCVERNHAE
jgi:hypothetical protein